MRKICLILAYLLVTTGVLQGKTSYTVSVKLWPAGSFVASGSEIKGKIVKKEKMLTAKSLRIPVDKLKTGIELRDKHLKKWLMDKKSKYIKIKNAKGMGGKGTATLIIKKKKVPIKFTYNEVNKKEVEINFPLSIKKFGITGIKYMGVGVADIVKIRATLPFSLWPLHSFMRTRL